MPEPLITVDAFGLIIDKTPKAMHHMHSRGQLPPAVKIGRRLLWRPEDVDAWIAANLEHDAAPVTTTEAASVNIPPLMQDRRHG